MSRVKQLIVLYEKPWDGEPSSGFLHNSHRSPEYDAMSDSQFGEHLTSRLSIDLLSNDAIDIPDDLPRSDKFISISDTVDKESRILPIIFIKHLRSCTIIGKIFGNVLSGKSFHRIIVLLSHSREISLPCTRKILALLWMLPEVVSNSESREVPIIERNLHWRNGIHSRSLRHI